MNVEGTIAIADPLEGVDLAPLAELVSDPNVAVIMHAPHADLVAFALRHGSTPTAIFDTQLAAGFVGLSAGLAYERLVSEVTGQKVAPSESFSDWSRRPLTDKQLVYAAEDVEYLFDMHAELSRRLDDMGRTSWASEELARRFDDINRLVTRPEEAWRKVGRRGKLQGKDLGVLREIAAWRENRARTKDIPVSWVMKDPSLVEIARRKPATTRDLSRVRGVDGGLREDDRRGLVQAVERGLNERVELEESKHAPRAVRKRVLVAKGLATALLRARCEAADIASELVGTSQDVEDLISWTAWPEAERDDLDTPSLLSGWREQFGSELVDLVDGRLQLRLGATEPYLVVERLSALQR
jgi:ribonuclease D